jgi:glycerophosphoryl diester phosphodiesterase
MKSALLALLCGCAFIGACSGDPTGLYEVEPLVIAHRGASYVAPEHTVAAYDRAVEQGADYVEQDVARTADGVLVVIHDATLDRTARGPAADCTGAVRDKTLEQLRRCDFGAWFNERYPDRANSSYPGQKILTLQEVITLYRNRAGLYVEIKNPELYPGIEGELAQLVRSAGFVFGGDGRPPVFVQSFSAESLKRLHAIDAGIPLVQLLPVGLAVTPSLMADIATYAETVAPAFQSTVPAFLTMARDNGLAVHVYAVEGTGAVAGLLRAGVEGLIVDRPDVVREVIFSR